MERAISRIAAPQLGVITRSQLLGAGLGPSAITRLIAKGRLIPVHRGVHRLNGLPKSFEQLLVAALLSGGPGTAISHLAAAVVFGFEGIASTVPELSVLEGRKLRLKGVIVHRVSALGPRDVCRRGPLRLTTPARTLVDLAGLLPPDALEDAIDSALRRGLTSLPTLKAAIDRRGGRGVRGIATLQALIDARTPGNTPGSSKENELRRLLVSAGLPAPVTQHEIRDERGRFVARVDLAYPEQRVAIEYDGGHHADRRQWESDLPRQNRINNVGYHVLRYCKRDLNDRPSEVVDEVRCAIGLSPT